MLFDAMFEIKQMEFEKNYGMVIIENQHQKIWNLNKTETMETKNGKQIQVFCKRNFAFFGLLFFSFFIFFFLP